MFRRQPVNLQGAILKAKLPESDRRAAKTIGLNQVRTGLQIAAVNLRNNVRPRQVENLGAVLLPQIVPLDVETHRLHATASAAVTKQYPLPQMVK